MSRNQVRKPIVQFVCLVVGVVAFLAAYDGAYGQTTGKVIGTVTDQDTGQPLVGAQVVIEGTNLGNVTNEDGYYFVNNVPVGIERITAQYLGYQTTTREERILAGQTMTVDFALSSEVVQAEGIVAVIEREPLVARDNTISKSRFTAEDARELPVDNINEVIGLGSGIYFDSNQGGFIIRGGRGTEAATLVDGVLVTDFSTQRAGGATGANNTPIRQTESSGPVGNFAVEEVDVITGGFNAEFGNAQSGIINVVTREGGREYHGNLRYTTDGQYGTDGYDADPSFPVEEETCCGFNQLQMSIGGPIFPDKLTVFGSLEATGAADFFPSSGGFNPAHGEFNSNGSTETILPGNRGDQTRGQAKVTAFPTGSMKVTGTYLYSRDQFENTQISRLMRQFLSPSATRIKTHDIIMGVDQQLFQTEERNLNLQIRGNFHQTTRRSGFPKTPELAAVIEERIGDRCGVECDVSESGVEDDFLNFRFSDFEYFFEDSLPGTVADLPSIDQRPPDPIFGSTGLFVIDGMSGNCCTFDNERRYGLRVDLDTQLNRVHRGKAGVEWTWINLGRQALRLVDRTFADQYEVDPRVGAAYVQDRLDYGDLVIDVGLRWDHWNPNAVFPLFAGVVNCEITPFTDACSADAEIVEAPTRNELSPRLGVAHPITDDTQVRLSYGKFHQLPELRHFFSSFLTDFTAAAQNPNITYGNPNLDYVETTAFEAGITHLISDNLVVDLVGYNRDRRGAIRLDVFQPGEIGPGVEERRVFVNGDNGNVKGVDITLSKRYSNYFSTDLAWSLQWARGTTSSPLAFATGGGFGRIFDPLFPGRLLTPPTELQPEEFDRLHNVNWQFNLRFPNDFRQGTTVGSILKNFSLYAVYNAQSGLPYTRRSLGGQAEAVEDLGASRLPWLHSGDIRVTKGLDLGSALDVDLFASILNVLDIQNIVALNPTTGRPDLNGDEFQLSRNPVIPNTIAGDPVFVDGAVNAFPLAVSSFVPEFRDAFGKNDLNRDGTITLEEAQQNLFNALVASGATAVANAGAAGSVGDNLASNGDHPYNYGEPRQWRFGVELRF